MRRARSRYSRTPALATERLGRLHLSTLPRLDGDVERVPRVPPLAPRGNGKATTYRAPLATPGVGAGLTAATISSAVRAFSRSVHGSPGRFQRSFWQLLQARGADGGHPAGAVRLAGGRLRLRLPHRAPRHAIGGQEHRVRRLAVARLVAPQRGALRLVGSRGLVLQRPGATGGRRDQRPRQIPAYALTVLEYVSLAFRFRLDRRCGRL